MDSKYALGISELDAQHEEIEADFIAFSAALTDQNRWSDLPGMLDSLYEKLKFHFHAEESIMQIFAYPEALEHKKSHLEILKSVEVHKNSQLSDTEIKRLRDQPLQLFMEQILSQDMRFAAFIKRSKDRLGIQ